MSNERPIVVAPRPVRLSTLFTRKQDSDFTFIADISTTDTPDRISRPPSSAAALPPEALDEFLSILRPSFLRKPRSVTFPAFLPERSITLRQLPRGDSRADKPPSETTFPDDNLQRSASPNQLDSPFESKLLQAELDARQWFASTLLGSPISRFHTRNPFQRHREGSPVPASPLNPASIPLPTPSPGEFLENI